MKRLRIKQNLDGYSANALALAFGVDSHKVTHWIQRNMLRATRRGTERTERQGGDTYGSPTKRFTNLCSRTRTKSTCGKLRSGGSSTW